MTDGMRRAVAVGLPVLAAGLILLALFSMSQGEYVLAGLSFLASSLLIYYRETAVA